MTEIDRIRDQLRRAHEGNAWHGPALNEVLAGASAAQAAKRPIASAHTIWEIVKHVAVWELVVRRRLAGERIVELPPAEDWPAVAETTENAWHHTLDELERGYRQLQDMIARLAVERLNDPVAGKDYNVYVMLHGTVQHALYHAGQIALLKKA